MATVAETIRAALRTIGVLAASETPSASDQSDALVTLNEMLSSWFTESLVVYKKSRWDLGLVTNVSLQTFGADGTNFDVRPVRIERASISPNGSAEIPISILTDAEWQAVANKTATGIPSAIWVDGDFPNLSLYVWPISTNSADRLILYVQEVLTALEAGDELDLPPGYARAIRYCLAVELAPEYGVQVTPDLANLANEAKASLKRLNHQTSYLRCDPAMLHAGPLNIVSGDR